MSKLTSLSMMNQADIPVWLVRNVPLRLLKKAVELAETEAAQQSFAHDAPIESAKVVKCMHGYTPEQCSVCSARV